MSRALLDELIAARAAGSLDRVAAVLDPDVRYWDPSRDELRGREAVAAVLTGRVELESMAAAEADAVVELQIDARYRSTEVYHVRDGAITSIRAYFDPAAAASGCDTIG